METQNFQRRLRVGKKRGGHENQTERNGLASEPRAQFFSPIAQAGFVKPARPGSRDGKFVVHDHFNHATTFSSDQIVSTDCRPRAMANLFPFTRISAASGRAL